VNEDAGGTWLMGSLEYEATLHASANRRSKTFPMRIPANQPEAEPKSTGAGHAIPKA
jgi:hypothetical protein